ncbi:MAG: YigZ family protein [Propionibacteriaceae bacterium]|jgi:uncharacterized YigZ family protein|nr:YigZ family protein [Propionibacteriaceae bacterium]
MSLLLPTGFSSVSEIVIKRSRFITRVARVDDEPAARAVVAEARATHPQARHHCQAFVIDDAGIRIARSSDDGEPAGTAGVPMLHAIDGTGLANLVAVVTRYFGGVKLGTGGLTRAYGQSVSQALAGCPRVELVTRTVWAVDLPYEQAGRVSGAMINLGAETVDGGQTHLVDESSPRPRGESCRGSLLEGADATATAPRLTGTSPPLRHGCQTQGSWGERITDGLPPRHGGQTTALAPESTATQAPSMFGRGESLSWHWCFTFPKDPTVALARLTAGTVTARPIGRIQREVPVS